MSFYSSEGSNSDMDMDLLEESEDELNITTYFHDDIEESSDESYDSNENAGGSLEDGINKKSLEIVENKKHPADADHTEVPMDVVEDCSKIEVVEKKENFTSEDDLTEVSMVLSPLETKNKHLTICPVCYEIALICKGSALYDNLFFACMQQRSKK